MAIMHFLQGTYSGRLGETVGAGWKGKKTVRTAAVSIHDAKSSSQINVRNGFSIISKLASATNDIWLKTYFGKAKKMSAYNMLLKSCKSFFAVSPQDPLNIQFPQNYLGATVAPSSTPTLSGQTLTVVMPAAPTLAQGTPTKYMVAALQVIESTDADGNTRKTAEAVADVVDTTSSTVTVTLTLPVTVASGDTIYIYTQAGTASKVNYSYSTSVTAS